MGQLTVKDVSWSRDKSKAALNLGISTRGESSKTGRDQGVTMYDPYVLNILERRTKGRDPTDKVFPIKAPTYRKWWTWAAKKTMKADAKMVGPPHSARHTGASRDLAEGHRTFDQVHRRGRWKASASVQRYAKTHVWTTLINDLPLEVGAEGDNILASRPPRPPATED